MQLQNESPQPLLLTIPEAAKCLRISRAKAYVLVRRKVLPCSSCWSFQASKCCRLATLDRRTRTRGITSFFKFTLLLQSEINRLFVTLLVVFSPYVWTYVNRHTAVQTYGRHVHLILERNYCGTVFFKRHSRSLGPCILST